MAQHVERPMEVLWRERPHRNVETSEDLSEVIHRFGHIPATPSVSIVVPLYGRWDFVRYQMESFRRDPTLRNVEWIYVIDDPRIGDTIVTSSEALHSIFGLPFTIVYTGDNLGFSGACNLGARVARGTLLLLMNSDVFPAANGWLEPMIAALDYEVGAVGARLLYEDKAIQHTGLAFEPFGPWRGLHIITHPGKGLPDRLLPDSEFISAGATAACLLMRRTDYGQVGGLSERFIIGDFEDGDLSVRLTRMGKHIVTTPDARLYHLERQSIGNIGETRWREMLSLYNCWLFNQYCLRRPASLADQPTTCEHDA
jgi:GT2 family glycosyltransferase